MVIMDAYYSPDRLHEIWQTINQLHLSYLELEESPEKIDYRIRLEDCIREFLCIASHSKKFFLRETANVLYRSASTKKDFSGYKAATGWNAIQMYAGNLLSQPWRKEYRQIKTYCGFYKHQIEANLVGAEIMFEVMGYKHHSNGVLILEGPICPDTVTNVSKDCLIAYVECQIMKAIWEEISPTFKISWLEVLEFRKTHLCSPEQSIRALNYQFHEKQYQAQNHQQYQTQNADIYSRCHPSNVTPVVQYPHHSHVVPNIPPVNSYVYGTSTCCPNNYATYPYAVPVQYPPVLKPTNYYYTNGYLPPHQSAYGYTVPTGQLINLDSHQNGGGNYEVLRTKNETKLKESEKEESHFEDWDYVYHKLESQGYSKDLGERGDILSPTNPKKTRPTNLDEAIQQLTVTDRPLKMPEALQKYNDEVDNPRKNVERRRSESSSYENLTEVKKPIVNKAERRKTLPMKEKNANGQESNSKNLDRKDKWECKACTFHNENYKDICEMCSKTRTNVEQLMEIGGPQCSKCTLVNAKDSKVCQACGASLKDSPTYI